MKTTSYVLGIVIAISMTIFVSCDSSIVNQNAPSDSDLLVSNNGTAATVDQELLTSAEESLEGHYLILFEDEMIPSTFEQDIEGLGGTIIYKHESGFAYVSDLSDDAAAVMSAREDIAEFVANASFKLDPQDEPTTEITEMGIKSSENPATAVRFNFQWHLLAIEADKAWSAGFLGDENVTVGIMDSGIDYLYPDLAGLVDLDRSASFVPFDDFLVDVFFPGRDYATDLNFHGTHVAATTSSNALIAAGVTSKTTLTSIKVCNVVGSCNFGAIISGLFHAVDTGVDVANMSLGGAFMKSDFGRFVGFINKAMNTVRSAGVTVVVSAGNAASNLDRNKNTFSTYCDAPNVICVSATGPTASQGNTGPWTDIDAPAVYTNYGRSAIDVAAPGGNIGGSVWAGCSQTSLIIPVCQTGNFILGLGGTSMAAPHVSGLAALLVSQGIDMPSQIKANISQSADDLGQKGVDEFYGKGRINVANALDL